LVLSRCSWYTWYAEAKSHSLIAWSCTYWNESMWPDNLLCMHEGVAYE